MTGKKTDKLLKRPDAFQIFFFRILDWFKSQRKAVVLTIIPVLVIVLAASSWQYYRYWERGQRKHQLAEIEKIYSKEEKDAQKKKRDIHNEISKLEKASKDLAKDPAKAAANKAEIEAKNKESDAIEANHKESLPKYISFFHANEKNPEGWQAGMTAVSILGKDKSYEEAAGILSKILNAALGIEFYQVQVRMMYVGILEDLKKYDEAMNEIQKLLPIVSDELKPKVLLAKARLELDSQKREEAMKTLDMILSTHSDSPEARQAIAIKAL